MGYDALALVADAAAEDAPAIDASDPDASADDAAVGDASVGDASVGDAAVDDAAVDDASSADGGPIPSRCDWSVAPPAFGAPALLGAPNTSAPELEPVLSYDGLSLHFVSHRATSDDLYVATRASTADVFGAGMEVRPVSSSSNDTHFFTSADNLEAFVSSDRGGTLGMTDLFRATRTSDRAAWGSFENVAAVNGAQRELDPHLSADALTLWLVSVDRPEGAGAGDLFFAVRPDPASAFAAPLAAAELNTSADESDVSLTSDALVVVFASTRGGTSHIYYATRPSSSVPFGAPAVLDALDPYLPTLSDPFVSSDGCAVLFAATLPGGVGGSDLYVVSAL